MTLADLIARHRKIACDDALPYFVSDEVLAGFLNEAESEADIRGRLQHESADPAICRITVVAEQSIYPLHASLYEIDYAAFRPTDGTKQVLRQVSQEWLDANVFEWRDEIDDPQYVIQGDTTLRLVPTPSRDGLVTLEGYRTPKSPMVDPTDTPEINAAHHVHLVQWSLHRVFGILDSELFDRARSDIAEAEFSRYFGPRPDCDLRRITREDVPHAAASFFP